MEKELTMYTNAQITLSWDTKQTMEQYEEIRRDCDDAPYQRELFLEYVASNFFEWLKNASDKEIMRQIVILNDEGEELE
jgi:hypothetical protein